MESEQVQLKAMCVFEKDGKILVSKGLDKVKNEPFYRVLGGGINFFESSEEGIRREIREELNSEIENLKQINIAENIFVYQGEKCHEIDFLYTGDLARKELYVQNPIHIVEETYELDAYWVPVKELFESGMPIYPKFDYPKLFANL